MHINTAETLLPASVRIALWEGVYDLSFVKADGTVRHMLCTTNPALIEKYSPGAKTHEVAQFIDEGTDLVRAFDITIGEWRSFYATTIFRFEEYGD